MKQARSKATVNQGYRILPKNILKKNKEFKAKLPLYAIKHH
jgi:hypothetical protein